MRGNGLQLVKGCGLVPLAERAQGFGEGLAVASKVVSVWAELCAWVKLPSVNAAVRCGW